MKTLKDFQFKDKEVLLRADLNVPMNEKGEILDDFRIEKSLPTIKYLVEKQAKVVLLSHLTKGEEHSLKPLAKYLEKQLSQKVKFLGDCVGESVEKGIASMDSGEIVLLENPRFHPEEEENDPAFARQLSQLADIFINDAFGVSHREHASIVGLPQYLPSGTGLLLEKEIQVLSKVLNTPWHPLVAVIGGVKIEAKMAAIKNFLDRADDLLLGGEIANALLRVKGICISKPLPGSDVIEKIEGLELTNPKLHLPVDVIASPDKTGELYTRPVGPGAVRRDERIFDIGPETINMFSEVIGKAKMIIWSGPLGLFENPLFERGTKQVGDKIARNHKAFKVAGGGDTVLALKKFNIRERFDFVSTGGSAMLRFLAGEKLPGIKALK